jgi:hypothetical protein
MLCVLAAYLLSAPTPQLKPANGYPGYDVMDFWLGEWDVKVGDELAGRDVVRKILDGFAVIEEWRDAEGSEGQSFFYFMPAQGRWKQVWVTSTGFYKEKLSEPYATGVRFVGKSYGPRGRVIDDRTTLTRLPEGRVRQVIETSTDGGKTWTAAFDAVYSHRRQ